MDIVEVLEKKLAKLPSGDHSKGLRAVRLHIGSAINHLRRGQADGDLSAFTDSIYRCNQAFEGSVKEAYRVLAGKSPEKQTPANIEKFLSSGNILRQRVLDQFTRYRTEWRNPSTHDYMLDFDENEALLAIVSVTVFASVLSDQIATRLAADSAERRSPHSTRRIAPDIPLRNEVASGIREFIAIYQWDESLSGVDAAQHFQGSLAGHLSAQFSATPGVHVELSRRVNGREADVAVGRGEETIAIEVKMMKKPTPSVIFSGLSYLDDLISRGFSDGILLAVASSSRDIVSREMKAESGRKLLSLMDRKLSDIVYNFEE